MSIQDELLRQLLALSPARPNVPTVQHGAGYILPTSEMQARTGYTPEEADEYWRRQNAGSNLPPALNPMVAVPSNPWMRSLMNFFNPDPLADQRPDFGAGFGRQQPIGNGPVVGTMPVNPRPGPAIGTMPIPPRQDMGRGGPSIGLMPITPGMERGRKMGQPFQNDGRLRGPSDADVQRKQSVINQQMKSGKGK